MRLVIVSNRLPFTISQKNNELKFEASAGGLSSGLNTYRALLNAASTHKNIFPRFEGDHTSQKKKTLKVDDKNPSLMSSLWIGWPGAPVQPRDELLITEQALLQKDALPVYIDENDIKNFYNGFSNKTLWPLFHYFTEYVTFQEEHWQSYKRTNEIFRDRVLEVVQPGDILFIQDFHLMLLPKLLRHARPDIPIGFFLHTPFPSYEIFRLLPSAWRTELLEGVLGADLLGFQTYDYSQYFLQSVTRILGYEHTLGKIHFEKRIAQVATFPIGIDYEKFQKASVSLEIEKQKKKLKKVFKNSKVVLSMDRLDYTKGIVSRLKAFESLLETHPQYHKKVILVMVVIPSRTDVDTYQVMKREIDEIIGRINGKFGDAFWTPIIYQYKSLEFDEMVALYALSDIALITPFRDGMNLIAKEYLASKGDTPGVLILSEMAGASKELVEAITINPYSQDEITSAIIKGLEMQPLEAVTKNKVMQKRISTYTISAWAKDFITSLQNIREEERKIKVKFLRSGSKQKIIHDFKEAEKRLLLLDYDGILMPLAKTPDLAKPSQELLEVLKRLSSDPSNEIVVISGRSKEVLESWLGTLPLSLAAEHGVQIHKNGSKGWKRARSLSNHWKDQARVILESYVQRLPGSFIEDKQYSLVFHYRNADPDIGAQSAKELIDTLSHLTTNMDLQVLPGKKIVEIKNASIHKGTATQYFLSQEKYNFILAIGDDVTDEDMFLALPPSAYSIRVGMTHSHARFNVSHIKTITELLLELSTSNTPKLPRFVSNTNNL